MSELIPQEKRAKVVKTLVNLGMNETLVKSMVDTVPQRVILERMPYLTLLCGVGL